MDSFGQRDTIIINFITSYAGRIYSFLTTTDRQETIEPRTSTTLNHTHDVHGTNEPSPESHRSSTGRGVRTIGLIMKTSAVFFTRSSPRSRSSLGSSPSTFCLLLSPLREAVSLVGRNSVHRKGIFSCQQASISEKSTSESRPQTSLHPHCQIRRSSLVH